MLLGSTEQKSSSPNPNSKVLSICALSQSQFYLGGKPASSGYQYLLCDIWEKEGRESQTAKDCILIHTRAGEKMDNTRTALTTIVADSVSKNSSWLSSREFPIQLLCVCPRSKEHTQPIPGQSKFPYILQWVTHCFLLASPQKKCWGRRKRYVVLPSYLIYWTVLHFFISEGWILMLRLLCWPMSCCFPFILSFWSSQC